MGTFPLSVSVCSLCCCVESAVDAKHPPSESFQRRTEQLILKKSQPFVFVWCRYFCLKTLLPFQKESFNIKAVKTKYSRIVVMMRSILSLSMKVSKSTICGALVIVSLLWKNSITQRSGVFWNCFLVFYVCSKRNEVSRSTHKEALTQEGSIEVL